TRPVVHRTTGQPVTVRDLDGVDTRGVERGHDLAHVLRGDAVADGMHAVAQGHILNENRGRFRRAHRAFSLSIGMSEGPAWLRSATASGPDPLTRSPGCSARSAPRPADRPRS